MMKSTEEATVKIPILKYDGRQNLDFTAWKKSFATSKKQKQYAKMYRDRSQQQDTSVTTPVPPSTTADAIISVSCAGVVDMFRVGSVTVLATTLQLLLP